jgi:transposase
MNNPLVSDPMLRGLDIATTPEASAPAPKTAVAARARVKPVERSQLIWRTIDVENLIEEDHPARAIWAFVGGLDLKAFYAPIAVIEGEAGRPAWDPRLLVSLWVYSYSRGIGSAREIARRCSFDPAFQWLCGMDSVNYHTLSDFRVHFEQGLKELFVQALGVLSAVGLISLERTMHDGTKVKACAAADSFRSEECLQAHLAAARQQIEGLEENVEQEPTRQRAAQQRAAQQREQRVMQALQELQAIRQSKHGPTEKESARASMSDPQARIMKQSGGGYAPSYNVQLSTDAQNKIIVGAGVSQNSSDYGELAGGLQRVEQNLGRKPAQVVTDGGFTSRENILQMAAQGIDFIGPDSEQEQSSAGQLSQRGISPQFHPQAFVYDAQQDTYCCPAGQSLRHAGQEQRPGVIKHQYRAELTACKNCLFKPKCCPQATTQGRSLIRTVEAPEVSQFRQKMRTPEAKEIYRQRSEVAEFPNAWIKDKFGLRQFHVRGLAKVLMEVLWVSLTYNIKQWIRLCWRTTLVDSKA